MATDTMPVFLRPLRRGALIAGMLCALGGCAGAIPLREAAMRPLPLPEVAAVREISDRAYLDPRQPAYAYDLFLPDARVPQPLLLVVHGGAPAAAELRKSPLMRSWAQQIAARTGAAVALVGWDGNQRKVEQIDAAYAHLRAHAGEYGIDAARPCIVTFSAGVASVLPHALRSDALAPRCLVGYYGDWAPALDALPAARAGGLPILVVRAGRDEIVPDTTAPAFVAAARRAGAEVEVLEQARGLHAFETRNPDRRTVRVLDATLEFLRTHIADDARPRE